MSVLWTGLRVEDGGSRPASTGSTGSMAAVRFAPGRTVLSNGLTVLHQTNPVSPAVTVSLRVAAGSAFETRDRAGLANFCAAALKRGTQRRSKEEIGEVLDFTGATLSAGSGRHTAAIAAKARAADFFSVLELVAECAMLPVFPSAEIGKVRGQLLTGIREDIDDTRQVSMDRLREIIYPDDHPYSWRVSGNEETVIGRDRDELVAFHAAHYHAAGAVLVVVGAVDGDQVVSSAERAFGEWARGDAGGLATSLPEVADAAGPAAVERVVTTMPGKAQADIALGFPGLRRRDPRYYAATMMNMIFGRFGMGGRLGRSIREEQGMAYYAFSTLEATIGPGPFVVRAGVHPDNVDRALSSIVAELERIATGVVEEQEMSDAASALIRSVPRTLETNEGMAGALHAMEQYDLGLDYLKRYPELIDGVTREAVGSVAGELLGTDRYGISIAGPYPVGS
ncbi:MAG: M16 family metallopeptidase [Acidobacteriota bacterium]